MNANGFTRFQWNSIIISVENTHTRRGEQRTAMML